MPGSQKFSQNFHEKVLPTFLRISDLCLEMSSNSKSCMELSFNWINSPSQLGILCFWSDYLEYSRLFRNAKRFKELRCFCFSGQAWTYQTCFKAREVGFVECCLEITVAWQLGTASSSVNVEGKKCRKPQIKAMRKIRCLSAYLIWGYCDKRCAASVGDLYIKWTKIQLRETCWIIAKFTIW